MSFPTLAWAFPAEQWRAESIGADVADRGGDVMTFNGFISYSHAADGRLAPAIQRGLHHLAKPWLRRRALWIFRDQTGLSVTPALWSSIQHALDESDHFVLLASPEAARSAWVNREIEHWVATKSVDRILPVVTGGVWRWDPDRGDFAEDCTAVPAALRGVFAEEPLYLDLRWARDDRHLSLRHSRFRDAIAQLAAPMHGMSKDELEGEDVRQHRRARRVQSVAVASLLVLTLVALAAGGLAVRYAGRVTTLAGEARRQAQVVEEQEANAKRAADEAGHQRAVAERAQTRADDARADAAQQQQRAREQKALADQASVEADKQELLARDQKALARLAAADARRQQSNARQQRALAKRAEARAEAESRLAARQAKLARRWATQARAMQWKAQRAQAEAERMTKEADTQRAAAEKQERIAIGRRLINQAKAIADDDIGTALMLGVAARKVQGDAEATAALTGLVASTHYAGVLNDVRQAAYRTADEVVVEDSDHRLKLMNVTDRANPRVLHDLGVYQTWAMSPDGHMIAAAVEKSATVPDRYVALLDLTKLDAATPSDPLVAKIPVGSMVRSLAFSSNGGTLFVGAEEGNTSDFGDLWDLRHPDKPEQFEARFEGERYLDKAAFIRDSPTLVTMDSGGSIRVWDVSDPDEASLLTTLDDALYGERAEDMAFLPDKPTLVVGGQTGVRLVDLAKPADPQPTASIPNNKVRVTSVITSSDPKHFVTGDENGVVKMFDLGGGLERGDPKPLDSITNAAANKPVALSPDGQTLITTDAVGDATQWNVSAYGASPPRAELTTGEQQGLAAAYIKGSHQMVTVGTDKAAVWDLRRPFAFGPIRTVKVHKLPIYKAAITPDGRYVAVSDRLGGVEVTDLQKPEGSETVRFSAGDVWLNVSDEFAISADGRTIAIGNPVRDAVLWDVTPGQEPVSLGKLPNSHMPVAFNPQGGTFAAKSSGKSPMASLWRLDEKTRRPVRIATVGSLHKGSEVETITFSPDGNTVALGSYREVGLFDVRDPDHVWQSGALSGQDPVGGSVAFSSDGATIATLHHTKATLWDVTNQADPVRIAVLQLPATQAFWSSHVTAILTDDAKTLTTSGASYGGVHGTATVWDLTKLAELRDNPTVQACRMAGRGLNRDEWARYLPKIPYESTCTR